MMLEYKITSDEKRTIEGLGVFAEGETKYFNEVDADNFIRIRGVPLNANNVPDGVTVEIGVFKKEG